MEKLLLRYADTRFGMQALLAFLALSVCSMAAGGYTTLEPTLISFALHFGPHLILGLIFAAFFKLFRRLLRG